MKQVLEGVTLPSSGLAALQALVAYMTPLFRDIGFRLNRCLPRDGSERMTNPMPLAVYSTATTPPASAWPGCLIFVNDVPANQALQYSDGVVWTKI